MVTGIIGDLHAPFNHPNYLKFIKKTFKKWGVQRVICIGDIVDQHQISRHISEPDALGAITELELARKELKCWYRAFPELIMTVGNHDDIPVRQAKELGIPKDFIRGVKEMYNMPKKWKIVDSIVLDDVIYEHGVGSSGKDSALNTAIQCRMSYVQGHAHSYLGCKYNANPSNIIYGLNVGCGIDIKAYAARYGMYYKKKPTLGCGIVVNSREAYAIPMDMNKYGRSK